MIHSGIDKNPVLPIVVSRLPTRKLAQAGMA